MLCLLLVNLSALSRAALVQSEPHSDILSLCTLAVGPSHAGITPAYIPVPGRVLEYSGTSRDWICGEQPSYVWGMTSVLALEPALWVTAQNADAPQHTHRPQSPTPLVPQNAYTKGIN